MRLALEDGIPFTDPSFYSCPERCPDSAIESVFTPAPHCTEHVPLIKERIRVLREVGSILCEVTVVPPFIPSLFPTPLFLQICIYVPASFLINSY